MAQPIAKKNFGPDADSGLTQRVLVDSMEFTKDGKIVYNCREVLGNPNGDGYQLKRVFRAYDIAADVLTAAQINKLQTIAQNKMDLAQGIDTYMTDLNATL